jgi:hypothetical protein
MRLEAYVFSLDEKLAHFAHNTEKTTRLLLL